MTKRAYLDLSGEGDPESNLASSAVSGQSPPAGRSAPRQASRWSTGRFHSSEKLAERGHKPGFYVVVSRSFIAQNEDVATVLCAPIYSEFLGLATEVEVGTEDGLRHGSSVRCDFLRLMFKRRLITPVGRLGPGSLKELDRALAVAPGLR